MTAKSKLAVVALCALAALLVAWRLTRPRPEVLAWLEPEDGVQPADIRTGELVTVLRGGDQGEAWRVRREWLL